MHCKLIPWKVPRRFIIVLMVFFGYINIYYIHTNIGMAAVEMTSVKKILHDNGTVELQKPEYNWSPQEKALVLSSFSYGRLFGPIGGAFAGRFGGSTVYGSGILVTSLLTLLSPLFLHVNFYLFVIAMVLCGAFEAFAYASVSQIWSRWIIPNERAKCISLTIIGSFSGCIVSFIIAGWILMEWGWRVLFYASGFTSFVWFWIWTIVVKNDPSNDKHMLDEERKYIADHLNHINSNEKLRYPWKNILTCIPFWVGCSSKFVLGCGYTFTMMCLPQYIKDVTNADIDRIGYISVIPQLCSAISIPIAGWAYDYIRTNKILSLTNGHKLYVCVGSFFGAITFFVAGLWPNFSVCIVSVSMFQIFSTLVIVDVQVLVLDLAPRYAAFMNAVANSFLNVAAFLTPIFVGFVVKSHNQFEWGICFLTIGGLFVVAAALFLRFGSGELQSWANYLSKKRQKEAIEE